MGAETSAGKQEEDRVKLKTKVKAGGVNLPNSNETVVAARKKGSKKGLKVKTRVRAGEGRLSANSNQTVVTAPKGGLKVKTKVKAGRITNIRANATSLGGGSSAGATPVIA